MDTDKLQPYLGIAVSVLATCDAQAAQKLKAFLVSMPSSKQIEQTLGYAVVCLAAQDPDAFEWVLRHQVLLMPELDLQTFVKKLVVDRLCAQGWTPSEDLDLALRSLLLPSGELIGAWAQHFSQGERLLVASILSLGEKSL